MAFFSKLLTLIPKVIKPVANAVTGIINAMDSDGSSFSSWYQRNVRPGVPFAGIPPLPTQGVISMDMQNIRVLDDSDPQDVDEAKAVFAAEQARSMNVILKEIPFLLYEDMPFECSQSIRITIPSGLSLVQRIFANPLMNLGGKIVKLSKQFRVMRINTVTIKVEDQNQNYSSMLFAYNPVVTKRDRIEMVNDLELFYQKQDYVAIGARTHYFWSDADKSAGKYSVIDGDGNIIKSYDVDTFSNYSNLKNAISNLKTSSNVGLLQNQILGINQPGMSLCPMKEGMSFDPIYHPGMEYVGLSYATDFIKENLTHMKKDEAISTMPVYGTFYYCISNNYEKDVSQVLTITYTLTCKESIVGATYMNPNSEPIL